jgi:hypothetical protein
MTVGNATGQFRISGGGGGSDVVNGAIYLTDNTYNAGGYTATSGTQTTVQIGGFGAPSNLVWKPASGTANYTLLAIPPGISGSGTYSGTIRGIYYNPTVSSTIYGAHRAIETTAGDVVFSGGYVGIGRATNYGLEIANTSSLRESAYTNIPFGYATGSAAVSITPNIYATTGQRSFYSLYIGNPTITISGSFGNYDYRGLYVAGGSTLNGGIIAGDSRFFATSNAVSFQGYNPFNGQTGDVAGGITFTSRQVAGGDEAGIGAYYGGGSRLYLYNKYNASDSKIIFAVGGTTIRGAFFGTGNLSIGNGETDMSARLGVKGSGTTDSTTSLLVQNSSGQSYLQVVDNGVTSIGKIGDGELKIFSGNYRTYAVALSNKLEFQDAYGVAGALNSTGLVLTSTSDPVPKNRLDVAGRVFIGSTVAAASASLHISSSLTGSTPAVLIQKSGSTVLDIQGSQGQLFSVIDALSGSLMSVNDVSGLPILEVFSDDRVVMGTYGAPGLTVSGSLATVATGSSAPTGTAPEGTFRFAVVGGLYYIYAYIGGAWRSGSLT